MQHLHLSEKRLPQQTQHAKGSDPQVDYMATGESQTSEMKK